MCIRDRSQADALGARIVDHVGRIKVGDGMSEGVTMGPLVSKAQLETVEGYVRAGVGSGCRLVAGGHRDALGRNIGKDRVTFTIAKAF